MILSLYHNKFQIQFQQLGERRVYEINSQSKI